MGDERVALRKRIQALYQAEHEALGEAGTYQLLEAARQWDLAPALRAGGVIVFPHAGVADCGHQIAAAVHACLDSGAERVLVISVLHAFTEEMEAARIRVAKGGDPAAERFWGIQGAGLAGERQEWQHDHALYSWRHFWHYETKRRGGRAPAVIERYPYLAGGHPERLPGVEEVERLARDAVIVSTADSFHHGIGYGDHPEQALNPDQGGLDAARRSIEEGIELLAAGDYAGYNQHCVLARSDARDAGQLFRYLRGPMQGRIIDLTYSDASTLYQQPAPTWVAAALVEWRLHGDQWSV
jgi:hypothetical protein